jgi:hypothetical protein
MALPQYMCCQHIDMLTKEYYCCLLRRGRRCVDWHKCNKVSGRGTQPSSWSMSKFPCLRRLLFDSWGRRRHFPRNLGKPSNSLHGVTTRKAVLVIPTSSSHLHQETTFNFAYTLRFIIKTVKKTRWPKSASELYRPSDRRLSTKLVSTFAGSGCRVVSATDPYGRMLEFPDRSRYYFLPSSSSIVLTRLSGPRSRPATSYKNLVAPGIEPATYGSVARNSDH